MKFLFILSKLISKDKTKKAYISNIDDNKKIIKH